MTFQFAQFTQMQTLYLTANQIPITTTIHSSHKHTLHFTIKYTHFKTTNTHSLFYVHPYSIHSIPQHHQTIHNHSSSISYSLSPFLYSLNHSSSHTHFPSTPIYANHSILSTHLASFQTTTLFSSLLSSIPCFMESENAVVDLRRDVRVLSCSQSRRDAYRSIHSL